MNECHKLRQPLVEGTSTPNLTIMATGCLQKGGQVEWRSDLAEKKDEITGSQKRRKWRKQIQFSSKIPAL